MNIGKKIAVFILAGHVLLCCSGCNTIHKGEKEAAKRVEQRLRQHFGKSVANIQINADNVIVVLPGKTDDNRTVYEICRRSDNFCKNVRREEHRKITLSRVLLSHGMAPYKKEERWATQREIEGPEALSTDDPNCSVLKECVFSELRQVLNISHPLI